MLSHLLSAVLALPAPAPTDFIPLYGDALAHVWSPMVEDNSALDAITGGKGCAAVTRDQCATDLGHSCMKCGSASAYDCEQCCLGCISVTKGVYKYCTCGKPGPSPSPSPSPSPGRDTWDNYNVGGMDVRSVTGGHNKSNYQKVVIMLHGGGGSGADWQYNYQAGWFGDLSGIKYVFPTSAIQSHVWYNSYKIQGCGLADDCAYDIASIHDSARRVAALIEHEKSLVGGDASKVFLAGFSQGAQLTGYMQLAKLDYALGGVIVMDGFPLPPLFDMVGKGTAARQNATYYGNDMKWMIWEGSADPIFPASQTLNSWNGIFRALGVSSVVKIEHTEPGMTHTLIQSEFEQLVRFVRGQD